MWKVVNLSLLLIMQDRIKSKVRALSESNYSVKDLGPSSKDSVDYPDYAHLSVY